MTAEEKQRLEYLRSTGIGYKKIAQTLGLAESTVKSYFRRRKDSPTEEGCPVCGKKVDQHPHRKRKRFCSDACRLAWWKQHSELMETPGMRTFACLTCGSAFQSYRPGAKYCSRECYHEARREAVRK